MARRTAPCRLTARGLRRLGRRRRSHPRVETRRTQLQRLLMRRRLTLARGASVRRPRNSPILSALHLSVPLHRRAGRHHQERRATTRCTARRQHRRQEATTRVARICAIFPLPARRPLPEPTLLLTLTPRTPPRLSAPTTRNTVPTTTMRTWLPRRRSGMTRTARGAAGHRTPTCSSRRRCTTRPTRCASSRLRRPSVLSRPTRSRLPPMPARRARLAGRAARERGRGAAARARGRRVGRASVQELVGATREREKGRVRARARRRSMGEGHRPTGQSRPDGSVGCPSRRAWSRSQKPRPCLRCESSSDLDL